MLTADRVCRPSCAPAFSSRLRAAVKREESVARSSSGVWSRHRSTNGTLCLTVQSTAASSGSFWLMSTPMRSSSFDTEEPRPKGSGYGEQRADEQHGRDGTRDEDRRAAMRHRERLAQRVLENRAEHQAED